MNLRAEIIAELQERRKKAFENQTAVDHGRALAFDEAIEIVLNLFGMAASLPLVELAPDLISETDLGDLSTEHYEQYISDTDLEQIYGDNPRPPL